MNEDVKYVYLNWEHIETACQKIYSQMVKDNYKPDCIIGLSRGGVVPARLFSDYFDVVEDVFSLDVKMYIGIKSALEEAIIRPFHDSFHDDVKGKNILVVDDIWDSGITMKAVLRYLKKENLTTTTLYWNSKVKDRPDYFAATTDEGSWTVFPWEKEETKRELAKGL